MLRVKEVEGPCGARARVWCGRGRADDGRGCAATELHVTPDLLAAQACFGVVKME